MPKKKKSPPRANDSFAQLVSQESLNNMKPYVDEAINKMAQTLLSIAMNNAKMLTLQLDAVKKGLETHTKFTEEEFTKNLWDIEDSELNLTPADTEYMAQTGDKVRVLYTTFRDGQKIADEKFSALQKLGESESGNFILPLSVQRELVGLKVGDTKSLKINSDDPKKSVTFEVAVKRISTYPKSEAQNEG
jgi:hypothetical protein